MTKPNRQHIMMLLVGVLTTGAGVGCVSQQEYDSVSDTNMTYQQRLEELQQENRTLQSSLDRKTNRVTELEAEVSSYRSTRGEIQDRISRLQEQQRNMRQRLGTMNLNLVDPDTDRALAALAAQNPELIEYDGNNGMIRFKSDLTFGSGSDVVKETAAGAIAQLGEILASATSQGYDLHVIGHTDNQLISNPATKRNHPTNRHLSVHRAISVSEMMQRYGIPADKILVAGWGSNRPAVPNNPKGGTAANRRVEIFVMASNFDSNQGGAANDASNSTTATADEPERSFPMK